MGIISNNNMILHHGSRIEHFSILQSLISLLTIIKNQIILTYITNDFQLIFKDVTVINALKQIIK